MGGSAALPCGRSSAEVTARPPSAVGGVRAQAVHRAGDLGQVVDPDRQLVGGVQAVLDGEVVEQVEQGAALGLQRRGQLGDEQRGRDAVLVPDAFGVDAVAERLLVAVAQARRPGRST